MTDRRVGGEGLNVDLRAGESRVGGGGLNVDVVPPHPETQTAAIGLMADITLPPLAVSHVALLVDAPAVTTLRLGNVGLLIDYVPSLVLVDAVTWTGLAFNIGGAFPDVHWSAGKFQSASGPRVLWDATAGTFTLEGV